MHYIKAKTFAGDTKNMNKQKIPQLEGRFNDYQTWEFHLSNKLPNNAICTVTVGVVFHHNGVIMTRNHRGWELPGGHIESEETLEEALFREVEEEGGIKIDNYSLFGYRVLYNRKPGTNRATGEPYPDIAYIPHYISYTKNSPGIIDCEDCFEAKICKLTDDEVVNSNNYDIIMLAYKISTQNAGKS